MVDGEREVKSGVPQGSILGPVLFTVAVNGLSGVVSSKVLQYADHIVLYRKVNSEADCLALQKDLDSLTKWCEEVGLDINPKKSQHLRISNKNFKTAIPTGSYNFNGEAIPTEEEAECLGVTFSSRLDWTGQVDKVVAKCRKRLYAIKAFFPRRFGVVKQLLFKSIVRSVMDHASSWHSTRKGLQKKLGNIQKKFLQTIRFGCLEGNERHDVDFRQYRQHLAEVGWHPLWQRRLEAHLEERHARKDNKKPGQRISFGARKLCASVLSIASYAYESTIASFAYVAVEILKDPLFCPSPGQLLSVGAFKNYLATFKFSNTKWCKDFIDPSLFV
ncbi:hypothetical protein RvY_16629 [Ramazzottius varieornatus]|uniref:Reverse transcriptase domain-containing protein n=1 Tax=Ramazzottius varieornatus TaxID=947166 RepID=A0A1D1VZ63_RAMVA|nr:hypothetical protein RvY_16629 [Ramazzottius varieornatus]